MSSTTDVHPEAVLAALLAKGSRAQVQRTLHGIHDICRKQFEAGSKDFSLSTIGRLCQELGLFNGRILYNASSRDYKELIQAWAAYVGPPIAPPPKSLASHQYLMKIQDPAIRSIMQATIAERDKLRAQINQLKSNSLATIDLRPSGVTMANNPTGPMAILEIGSQLTQAEREAIQRAISPIFLEEQGWTEGDRGEIRNGKRVIFPPGFATALRRILGVDPTPATKKRENHD